MTRGNWPTARHDSQDRRQSINVALKIGIEGFLEEGGGLGEILVDDVYVGRSREKAKQGARGE